jgi:hypothetical protein
MGEMIKFLHSFVVKFLVGLINLLVIMMGFIRLSLFFRCANFIRKHYLIIFQNFVMKIICYFIHFDYLQFNLFSTIFIKAIFGYFLFHPKHFIKFIEFVDYLIILLI